jgi:hypothetical protein
MLRARAIAVTVKTLDSTGRESCMKRAFWSTQADARHLSGQRRLASAASRIGSHGYLVSLGKTSSLPVAWRIGLSIIIYMGEEQKGWIWVFPLGEERITAGFVAQNSYLRDQQKKLKASGSKDWKTDLCLQELMQSEFVRGLLKDSRMLIPMQVNGNYSYEVKKPLLIAENSASVV